MYNLSSAEGARFAEVCKEMTEKITAMGPSPLKRVGITGEATLTDETTLSEGEAKAV
jgi:hypothetical protein